MLVRVSRIIRSKGTRRVGLAARLFVACTLGVGCRAVVPVAYQVEPTPAVIGCAPTGCAPADEQVEITYLGVSGFMVRYRGAVLLTAPFFTNPSLDALARDRRVRPDTALIDRLLPAAADAATMILVGHAHYDHLLDVPYLARRHATGAVVYGSPTMRHTLMGDASLSRSADRVVAIAGDDVGSVGHAGRWYYNADSTFRIMALAADHAPTFKLGPIRSLYAKGTLTRDRSSLPARPSQWKAGEPLAYLIDVLRRGEARPRLRIYFQDAPNTPPLGFPPVAELATRGVDVALLCAATSRNVPRAPGALLDALRPAYVVVGHWESFFRAQTLPIVMNPATDADGFLRALTRGMPVRAGWQMPLPRTVLRFDLQ